MQIRHMNNGVGFTLLLMQCVILFFQFLRQLDFTFPLLKVTDILP